jgi:hypothetical protein
VGAEANETLGLDPVDFSKNKERGEAARRQSPLSHALRTVILRTLRETKGTKDLWLLLGLRIGNDLIRAPSNVLSAPAVKSPTPFKTPSSVSFQ